MRLSDLMDKMNYNLKARENTGKSMLPSIEKDLAVCMASMPGKTSELLSDFEANMFTNPEEFDNPKMYEGLGQVSAAVELIHNLQNSSNLRNEMNEPEIGRTR